MGTRFPTTRTSKRDIMPMAVVSAAELTLGLSFLKNFPGTHAPNFIPSNEDILRSYQETTDLKGVVYGSSRRDSSWRVYDTSGRRRRFESLLPYFVKYNKAVIIFTVDLGSLSETLNEDPTTNCFDESFARFCSIASAENFAHTKLVLCLTKKQKLADRVKMQGCVPNQPLYLSGLWESSKGIEKGVLTSSKHPIHFTKVEDVDWFIIRCFTAEVPESKRNNILTMVLPDSPQPKDWSRIKNFVRRRLALNLDTPQNDSSRVG